jgi:hypothetical protein
MLLFCYFLSKLPTILFTILLSNFQSKFKNDFQRSMEKGFPDISLFYFYFFKIQFTLFSRHLPRTPESYRCYFSIYFYQNFHKISPQYYLRFYCQIFCQNSKIFSKDLCKTLFQTSPFFIFPNFSFLLFYKSPPNPPILFWVLACALLPFSLFFKLLA